MANKATSVTEKAAAIEEKSQSTTTTAAVAGKEPATKSVVEATFSKERLLKASVFSLAEKAFLESILKDDQEYSIKGARNELERQFKKEVDK